MLTLTADDWLVILAGTAAIVWVNWYFFVAGRRVPALVAQRASAAAPAQVTITVDGGYAPAHVRVKAGEPVRLLFDRKDNSGCSEEVVLPHFGVRRFLPTGQQTAVEITPATPGTYEFLCGMSMLRGTITVDA